MPQKGTITLNGSVYSPGGEKDGIDFWFDRTGSVPNSFPQLSEAIRPGQGSAKDSTKVQLKIKLPKVATEGASCACPGDIVAENIVDIVFTLANNGDRTDREELLLQVIDLVQTAEVKAAVEDLEPVW